MIIDGVRAADRATGLVLHYYAAFNRGDWEGMLECLTDDIAHDINQGKREVGKDAFRAFLERMQRSYRELLRDIVVMCNEDGSRAAAEFTVHGKYQATDSGLPKATGQQYVLQCGAFFDLRDGKIARISNYYNLQNWITQIKGSK